MSKISELSDGGSLLPTDDLIVVRSGGNVRVKADTVNVDQIRLGDNEQIQLGNSQDLTLVHTPTQSIINQAGVGDLLIQKAGSTKLTVNSSGIDVTGTVTASGNVAIGTSATTGSSGHSNIFLGGTANIYADTAATADASLSISQNAHVDSDGSWEYRVTDEATNYYQNAGNHVWRYAASGTAGADISWSEAMRISGGNVGIGCSPATPLNVAKTGDGTIVRLLSVGIGEWDFSMGNSSTLTGVGAGALELLPLNSGTGSEFAIGQAGSSTPVLHVKSGKVLIGTSTVAYAGTQLNIGSTSDSESGVQIQSATNGTGYVLFGDGASAAAYRGQINYVHATDSMAFHTAGAPAAMFDSSQNFLVGKTAAAFATAGVAVFGSGEIDITNTNEAPLYLNRLSSDGIIQYLYKDGTNIGSLGTVSGTLVVGSGDTGLLFSGAGDYIAPRNASTQAARDAAIALGTSVDRFTGLYLSNNISLSNANTASFIQVSDNILQFGTSTSDPVVFYAGNAEAARFDASQNFLVRCSATPSASQAGFMFTSDQLYTSAGNTTSNNTQVRFINGNGLVGNISTAGSGTAYATSSDQRLKDNIADADDSGELIDAIQVRQFDWKVDGEHQRYGMVAQELDLIAPEAVSKTADPEDMMAVDYSKLVPMMLKEIQSLRARVAQLES